MVRKVYARAKSEKSKKSEAELELSAILEGGRKSDLIGIREVDAEWKPTGEASNFNIRVILLEEPLEEEGGRFPFHARVGGDDDLFDIVLWDAVKELLNVELVSGDAVDRRNSAAEDMISAVELLGLLDGVDIEWFLDDKDGRLVALGVAVKLGNRFVGVDEGKSNRTILDAGMEHGESGGNVLAEARTTLEKIISIALSGAGANARKTA